MIVNEHVGDVEGYPINKRMILDENGNVIRVVFVVESDDGEEEFMSLDEARQFAIDMADKKRNGPDCGPNM